MCVSMTDNLSYDGFIGGYWVITEQPNSCDYE